MTDCKLVTSLLHMYRKAVAVSDWRHVPKLLLSPLVKSTCIICWPGQTCRTPHRCCDLMLSQKTPRASCPASRNTATWAHHAHRSKSCNCINTSFLLKGGFTDGSLYLASIHAAASTGFSPASCTAARSARCTSLHLRGVATPLNTAVA